MGAEEGGTQPAAGAGGSGMFAIQRRRRKARSLRAWLPKSAVPMIVSVIVSSIASVICPKSGLAMPSAGAGRGRPVSALF